MSSLEASHGIAVYHREHERHYAVADLERAARLRRLVAGITTSTEMAEARGPHRRAALTQPGAEGTGSIASHGVAVDADGPYADLRLRQIHSDLDVHATMLSRQGAWLTEKVLAGWAREAALVAPERAAGLPARFRALAGTTVNAERLVLAGASLTRAVELLATVVDDTGDAEPAAASRVARLRSCAWLVESAALLLTDRTRELATTELAWLRYLECIEDRTTP